MYFFSEYTLNAYYIVSMRLLLFETIDESGTGIKFDVIKSMLISVMLQERTYEKELR